MLVCFFFNDTATTEIYTLSLHDALPIWSNWWSRSARRTSSTPRPGARGSWRQPDRGVRSRRTIGSGSRSTTPSRSEEHTSELQSRQYLVCRLLLEKKKKTPTTIDELYYV